MPTKTGTPKDKVREIVQDALSRPEDMSLEDLVNEIMEASGAEGIKNYAIGFMGATFMRREGFSREEAEMKAEQALKEAALI